MKPTIMDIAREANVSIGAVSSTLNDKAKERRIPARTVMRILQVCDRLGYVANHSARSLRMQRTHNLGVVVDISIQHSYLAGMISCLETQARRNQYHVNIGILHNESDAEHYMRSMGASRCDAIICVSVSFTEEFDRALKRLRRNGMPVVLLYCGENHEYDCVCPDTYQGAILAGEYLYRKGCRSIAVVGTQYRPERKQRRIGGYRRVLERHGGTFDPDMIIDCPADFATARDLWPRLRRDHPNLDGVMPANDDIALGLARGVRDEGLRVGKDVFIVAQNNTYPVRIAEAPLTSTQYDQDFAAGLVMEIVLQRLSEKDAEETESGFRLEKLQPVLIER